MRPSNNRRKLLGTQLELCASESQGNDALSPQVPSTFRVNGMLRQKDRKKERRVWVLYLLCGRLSEGRASREQEAAEYKAPTREAGVMRGRAYPTPLLHPTPLLQRAMLRRFAGLGK